MENDHSINPMSQSWYGGSLQSINDAETNLSLTNTKIKTSKYKINLLMLSKSNDQLNGKKEIQRQNWRVTLRHNRYFRHMKPSPKVNPSKVITQPAHGRILDIENRGGYDGLLSPTINTSTEFHKLRTSTWAGAPRLDDCNIENLPDELIQHVLTYVKDTDFQALALVSKKMRRLSMDVHFYRKEIMLNRNGPMVQHLLFTRKDERPSRERLVDCNIFRGSSGLKRRMRSGDYVHTEALSRHMEAQNKIKLFFLRKCISANVVKRQDVLEHSVRKNLVPTEAYPKRPYGGCSPLLLPQMQKLKMAFMQDRLRRALRRTTRLQQ